MKKNNIKPKQPTNDFKILKVCADFARPVFKQAINYIANCFSEKNNIDFMFINIARNKTPERIEEKIKESDVGSYDKILDYVRGIIVFKTLEDLFDFIKFAQSFDFSDLKLEVVNSENLKILEYGVNNFCLNENSLTDYDRKKYPFLQQKAKLRRSEYMDYKLYMKVPTKSSGDGKKDYIIAEVLCILEDFYKFYDLTHYLYEENRVSNKKNADDENLTKLKHLLIYDIHRYCVIEKYNQNTKHRIKFIDINTEKEQEKNQFFDSLSKSVKQKDLQQIKDGVIDKAADKGHTFVMLQITELLNKYLQRS